MEARAWGTKFGGVIYVTDDFNRAREKAHSFGKNFMDVPNACVERVDPRTLEILKGDGYRIEDLDA